MCTFENKSNYTVHTQLLQTRIKFWFDTERS